MLSTTDPPFKMTSYGIMHKDFVIEFIFASGSRCKMVVHRQGDLYIDHNESVECITELPTQP